MCELAGVEPVYKRIVMLCIAHTSLQHKGEEANWNCSCFSSGKGNARYSRNRTLDGGVSNV